MKQTKTSDKKIYIECYGQKSSERGVKTMENCVKFTPNFKIYIVKK